MSLVRIQEFVERVEKVGVTSGNSFQMSHAVFCSYQQKKKLYRIRLMHEKKVMHLPFQ